MDFQCGKRRVLTFAVSLNLEKEGEIEFFYMYIFKKLLSTDYILIFINSSAFIFK